MIHPSQADFIALTRAREECNATLLSTQRELYGLRKQVAELTDENVKCKSKLMAARLAIPATQKAKLDMPMASAAAPPKPPVAVAAAPPKPPVAVAAAPPKPPVAVAAAPPKPPVAVAAAPLKPPVAVTTPEFAFGSEFKPLPKYAPERVSNELKRKHADTGLDTLFKPSPTLHDFKTPETQLPKVMPTSIVIRSGIMLNTDYTSAVRQAVKDLLPELVENNSAIRNITWADIHQAFYRQTAKKESFDALLKHARRSYYISGL